MKRALAGMLEGLGLALETGLALWALLELARTLNGGQWWIYPDWIW